VSASDAAGQAIFGDDLDQRRSEEGQREQHCGRSNGPGSRSFSRTLNEMPVLRAAAKRFNNNAFAPHLRSIVDKAAIDAHGQPDQVDTRFDRASLNCPATDGAARDDHFRPVDLSELANRALSAQEWSVYVAPTHLVTKDNIGINGV
jgi:hypothetical protein